ncbi:MAG: hypothetical protein F9K43_00580 [Bauldia sp.]|nr:MAG: hypothetical protein F9K43_00580 [Bauldia sp.]
MTDFDAIAAAADAAIDGVVGESLRIEPMADGGYTGAGASDPDRPVRTVVGTFRSTPTEPSRFGGQSNERLPGLSRVMARETVAHLSAAVAGSLGYRLRKGDRVVRVDKAGEPAFEVAFSEPTDLGDLFIHLVT